MSLDAVPSLNAFREKLGGLPFPIASDWHRTVSREFGVLNEEHVFANRSTFVIGPEGTVVFENRAFQAGDAADYEAVIESLGR